MINEHLKVKGKVHLTLLDEKQNIKEHRDFNNLVVAVGKDYIASRMTSNASPVMSHMALGTGNVAASLGQTTLSTENTRVALTSSTVNSNTISYSATFGAGFGTGTITEAGIFNSATTNGGTMLCRVNFNEVNKSASDVIVISWNVTIE